MEGQVSLFVNYEISLALKKRGFNEKCIYWWLHENLLTDDQIFLQYKNEDDFAFAPTHMQAINWIEINHKIKVYEDEYFTDLPFGSYWWVKNNQEYLKCGGLDAAIMTALEFIRTI